jgi:SAM-dependent methyltransferase
MAFEERLTRALVDPADPFGIQAAYGRLNSGHWDPLIGNSVALACKLRRSQYVSQVIGGSRILDFGSGLGFLSCYLAQSAAVTGVELVPAYRDLSARLADVTGVTPRFMEDIPAGPFDAVVLANVVTHVRAPIEMLITLRDRLDTGGVLFVEDNNNWNSPLIRRARRREWRQVGLADQRARETRFGPSVARETYGLSLEQTERWAQRDRSALAPLRERAPYDIEEDMYHENAFRPQELVAILSNLGFVVSSVGPKYVFDFKRNPVVSHLFKSFPHPALGISPAFEVRAVKL